MTDASQQQQHSDAYYALRNELLHTNSVTDLYRIAVSDDFRADSADLPPEELEELRDIYREHQRELDGKVKLEEFNGQPVLLVGVEAWYSEKFGNNGVTLHIRPEADRAKLYKCLTSSAPVVRFTERMGLVPSEERPIRILCTLEPVSDPERARKGQKRWMVKRLPMSSGATSPF